MRPLVTISSALLACILSLTSLVAWRSNADQIEMQNGERYLGKIVSLTNDTVILQSDTLGAVRLPRGKVAQITLGSATPSVVRPPPARPAAAVDHILPQSRATNTTDDISAALKQLGAKTNFIQQVQ